MADRLAYGLTLFCEDFRIENTGKHMFIGVYQGGMNVHTAFPFVLHKFVFAIFYSETAGAFPEDITIRVFLPGDADNAPSLEVPIVRSELPPPPEAEDKILRLFIPIVAQPLVLRQVGKIMVRAICGDVTTKLGTLEVVQKLEEPKV